MFDAVIWLVLQVLSLYNIVIFAWVIMSVLIAFDIINRYQPIVSRIFFVLEQLVDPVLRPIRKYVPAVGGIDLSPIVLILGLGFVERLIVSMAYG